MRRRGLIGLFGVVVASCAAMPGTARVHASPRVPVGVRVSAGLGATTAHRAPSSCARPVPAAGAAARRSRPHDPLAFTSPQVRAMLGEFGAALHARYGAADERALAAAGRVPARVVVPVRVHVLADGSRGLPAPGGIEQQVRILNAAYGGRLGGADTGVSFRLESVDTTDDAQWFWRPHEFKDQIESALVSGGPGTLNLFTAAVGYEMLGFSTFPQWYRQQAGRDGVVVDYRSVPGGQFRHFSRGYTAVHEIGHWLGLFHTFENGCEPPGDGVDDTPYESLPTLGCPAAKDTCPAPGTDPVHNFMDYGYDGCMRGFTRGQGLRIRSMWAVYRTAATPPAAP